MTTKIDKVVIVGGGSAGWMTASTLISQFPDLNISVIESPNVPTVGVGESTIGGINNWTSLIGLDKNDFIPHTDATYKLSIRFVDFYKKGSGEFHYPFGVPEVTGNTFHKNDWYFKKFVKPETPVSDYASCVYANMALVNANKIDKNESGVIPNFIFDRDTAFHFDAAKFGDWLKHKYCLPRGVNYISSEVSDIKTSAHGVDSLRLSNGDIITADLFIDCTGFKSILMNALEVPFTSYNDMLPNNSAWATRVPYTDKETQLVNYTDCHAIDNGWVWTIPLWSRIGTGYVYSDHYVSDENALKEFKQHLKNKGIFQENLEYKNIKMRVGIHERIWDKNVCSIGLSAGFIEPLESTGLFTVHEFLLKLVRTIGRVKERTVSKFDKESFNYSCIDQFKGLAQFVAMHYALSHRDDTQYWIDISNKSFSNNLTSPSFKPTVDEFVRTVCDRMQNYRFDDFGGMHCIATGMNFYPTDQYALRTTSWYQVSDKTLWQSVADKLDAKKSYWNSLVHGFPSSMEYLYQNHYKNFENT